nr:MAG TPA: hypothetical protein [Crassvirales sp.]
MNIIFILKRFQMSFYGGAYKLSFLYTKFSTSQKK